MHSVSSPLRAISEKAETKLSVETWLVVKLRDCSSGSNYPLQSV